MLTRSVSAIVGLQIRGFEGSYYLLRDIIQKATGFCDELVFAILFYVSPVVATLSFLTEGVAPRNLPMYVKSFLDKRELCHTIGVSDDPSLEDCSTEIVLAHDGFVGHKTVLYRGLHLEHIYTQVAHKFDDGFDFGDYGSTFTNLADACMVTKFGVNEFLGILGGGKGQLEIRPISYTIGNMSSERMFKSCVYNNVEPCYLSLLKINGFIEDLLLDIPANCSIQFIKPDSNVMSSYLDDMETLRNHMKALASDLDFIFSHRDNWEVVTRRAKKWIWGFANLMWSMMYHNIVLEVENGDVQFTDTCYVGVEGYDAKITISDDFKRLKGEKIELIDYQDIIVDYSLDNTSW